MSPTIIRLLFSAFLVAHGLIHMSLATVPPPTPEGLRTPFFPAWWNNAVDTHWPASRLGLSEQVTRTLGWMLWLLVTVAFALAGLALLVAPAQTAVWQGFAVAASLLSLVFLGLYWHPWLPLGILINLVLLAGIGLRWTAFQFAH